jgi:putative hydrolase of the HAD superfamily
VDWPLEAMAELNARWAERLGLSTAELDALWRADPDRRNTASLGDCLRAIGAFDGVVDELVALRLAMARRALVPRRGAVETLTELGARGIRRGLLSVCSEDVPAVWAESELAPHLDATVFSATSGLVKPDPRSYELACAALGVRPDQALFVGDGANDELAGAERAGLRAVLVHRPGRAPIWPGLDDWHGPRISSLPQVLELL